MIVPDASAAVLLFGDPDVEARVDAATQALGRDPAWMVPEHWRIEVLSSIRGLERAGRISPDLAAYAVQWLRAVAVDVAPTAPMLARIWALRENLSAYDAGYVALAEQHGLTLVTADARLVRSAVAGCRVQLLE